MKKFALILSGSGGLDGSEIHETTMLMLALTQQKVAYDCYAPDLWQHEVMNHRTATPMPEKRNMLTEAARLARGKIAPLDELKVEDYDAIMIPGGFGAAKNLDTYAYEGTNSTILPLLEKHLRKAHLLHRPIGALCIAPVILAKLVAGAKLTVGTDPKVGADIEKMGAMNVKATHRDVITDEQNLFFTTPCYMLDANVEQIYAGAYNIVKSILAHL